AGSERQDTEAALSQSPAGKVVQGATEGCIVSTATSEDPADGAGLCITASTPNAMPKVAGRNCIERCSIIAARFASGALPWPARLLARRLQRVLVLVPSLLAATGPPRLRFASVNATRKRLRSAAF